MKRFTCCLALWSALTLASSNATAEAASERARASEHFERGVRYLDEGQLESAVTEFESADELVPTPRTAYNIALAYARLLRPVESRKVLLACRQRHPDLPAELAQQVASLLADQELRVGQLLVRIEAPPHGPLPKLKVLLNGVEHPELLPGKPVHVAAGFLVVAISAAGMLPVSQRLSLRGGELRELKVELVPAEPRWATISVSSNVPGLEILLDGKSVGRTPLSSPLTTAPGRHEIRAQRPGYRARSQVVIARAQASQSVELDVEEDPSSGLHGSLALRLNERDAVVSVDGRLLGPYTSPLRLVDGPHRLEVDKPGHYAVERLVEVRSQRSTSYSIWLEPTPTTREAHADAVARRRLWGWAALLSGAALGTASTVLLAATASNISDNDAQIRDFNATTLEGGECHPAQGNLVTCAQRERALEDEQSALSRRRNLSLVGLGAGVAAAATGTILLLTGPDPQRYERRRFELSFAAWPSRQFSATMAGRLRF